MNMMNQASGMGSFGMNHYMQKGIFTDHSDSSSLNILLKSLSNQNIQYTQNAGTHNTLTVSTALYFIQRRLWG